MLQPDIDVNVSDYNIHGFSNLVMSLLFLLYLFVCFVALHAKSTAMVMAGRSVQLTTLFFPGYA